MSDVETSAADEQTGKPKRIERFKQNDITRPGVETLIGKLWDLADNASSELNRPVMRGELKERAATAMPGLNDATFATQFARWAKFHGVSEVIKQQRSANTAERKAAREAEAKETKAKAAEEAKAKAALDAEAKAEKEAEANFKLEEKARIELEKKAAKEAEKLAAKQAKEAEKAEKAAAKEAAKNQVAQAA